MKTIPTTKEVLKSNPQFTYAQAVGYSTGIAAANRGNQFEGLSSAEWRNANDEYAYGYRHGFLDSFASTNS